MIKIKRKVQNFISFLLISIILNSEYVIRYFLIKNQSAFTINSERDNILRLIMHN